MSTFCLLIFCPLISPSILGLCFQVEPFENGVITYSSDTNFLYDAGTMVEYRCNDGYELRFGDETRICVDVGLEVRGVFTGAAPICENTPPPGTTTRQPTLAYTNCFRSCPYVYHRDFPPILTPHTHTVCPVSTYFDGSNCSVQCPPSAIGNHRTGLCDACALHMLLCAWLQKTSGLLVHIL